MPLRFILQNVTSAEILSRDKTLINYIARANSAIIVCAHERAQKNPGGFLRECSTQNSHAKLEDRSISERDLERFAARDV